MQKILTRKRAGHSAIPVALILSALLCFVAIFLMKKDRLSPKGRESFLTYNNEMQKMAGEYVQGIESLSSEESVEGALEQALGHLFDENEWSIAPLSQKGSVGKGASGAQIYVAKSDQQQVLIKTYSEATSFYEETRALKVFSSLGLNEMHLPIVYGMWRYAIGGVERYMLLEEYLDGKSLYDYLISLLVDQNSKDRKANLTGLAYAYYQLGRGMAELHAVHSHKMLMHPRVEEMILDKVHNGSRLLAKNTSFSEEKLLAIFQKMHQKYRLKELVHGYMHNDPNPGNFYYVNGKEGVYMLDLQDGAISIDGDNRPIGLPMRDFVLIVEHIDLCRKMGGVNDREYHDLRTQFEEGYRSMGGKVPSRKMFRYCQWVNVMGFIEWYLSNKTRFTVATSHVLQRVYEQRIAWIKEFLREEV